MHKILTVVVLAISLALLYACGKNSSFMCADSMVDEYQDGFNQGQRTTCGKIATFSSQIAERLRSEGICR